MARSRAHSPWTLSTGTRSSLTRLGRRRAPFADQFTEKKIGLDFLGVSSVFNIGTIKTNMLFLKEPRTDRGTSIVFLSTRESGKHEGYAADLQVPWAAGARQGACCAALIDPLLVALEKR
jgi:hypothetical protein